MQSNLYAKIAIPNLLFLKALSDRVWIIYLCFFFFQLSIFNCGVSLKVTCAFLAYQKQWRNWQNWTLFESRNPFSLAKKSKLRKTVLRKSGIVHFCATQILPLIAQIAFFFAHNCYATKEIFWISVRKILRNETLFRNHYLKKILT